MYNSNDMYIDIIYIRKRCRRCGCDSSWCGAGNGSPPENVNSVDFSRGDVSRPTNDDTATTHPSK